MYDARRQSANREDPRRRARERRQVVDEADLLPASETGIRALPGGR
jgi:hypothetical protein